MRSLDADDCPARADVGIARTDRSEVQPGEQAVPDTPARRPAVAGCETGKYPTARVQRPRELTHYRTAPHVESRASASFSGSQPTANESRK
jgi:hypothetical protein